MDEQIPTRGGSAGNSSGPGDDNSGTVHKNHTISWTAGTADALGASGTQVIAIVWILTVLAAGFLAARIYSKRRSHRGLWWDDMLLTASWAMLALFAGASTYCVQVGVGSHVNSSRVEQVPVQLCTIIATVFSVLGAAWSKTSFALTLLRITGASNSRMLYWAIWGVVVSMNAVLSFNAIVWFVYCKPSAGAWDATLHARCWNRAVVVNYTRFAAAYSGAMDFALAVVPWAVILKLRSIKLREKLGVAVGMSLGVFAGCTAIMRSITVGALHSSDYTFDEGQLFIWTGAEIAMTIVATSIPILRALVSDGGGTGQSGATQLRTFQVLEGKEHKAVATRGRAASVSGGSEALGA